MTHQHLIILKSLLAAAFICLAALTACDTSIKTDQALIGEAIAPTGTTAAPSAIFKIDTAKSQLTWIGAKMTGRHNGVFKIQEGELHLSDSILTGGTIIIDMSKVRADDKTIDKASNEKLTKHMRSADFFDVEKYNKATFELTGIAPYDSAKAKPNTPRTTTDNALRVKKLTHLITGNLTIKDQTKSITFPARVTLSDNQLKAKANFNIDRTQWGLVYRSDKSLGDQTIRPEVNIGFDVVAIPQAN
ncbi:YceI family protein [Pontibacter sp. H249]|uniref:YceI family protein n=1 Tax=Pontibacter sp. H249 TaxID=3133420 RepID=UPI0030BC0B47